MADISIDMPSEPGNTLQGPLNSHPPDPPDSMDDNDPSTTPPSRRNTSSSLALTNETSDTNNTPTCRICRSESTAEEPLFYPCKCSGSIKYVHQECLMEWLSHSHKKHCELCKTPFRFTKLYDASMPQKLPWGVFGKRAAVHVVMGLGRLARGVLVSCVWLVILPWLVRFGWRWMFWSSDAGWARDTFLQTIRSEDVKEALMKANQTSINPVQSLGSALASVVGYQPSSTTISEALSTVTETVHTTETVHAFETGPALYNIVRDTLAKTGLYSESIEAYLNSSSMFATNGTMLLKADAWVQPDSSILSSWSYISEMTSNARLNRIILDVFEGQLITAVVITGFILVFLIREWVVQQQPLVNLENLGNVQAQLREAAERVQADNDRLRRQQELLEQARRRLQELQREHAIAEDELDEGGERFVGWDRLERMIDDATTHLRTEAEDERQQFRTDAEAVMEQIRIAGRFEHDLGDLIGKLSAKLASLVVEERREWESMLMAEVEKLGLRKDDRGELQPRSDTQGPAEGSAEAENEATRRPPMPERDFSSRATQIQRLLEEAEGIFQPNGQATHGNESQGLPAAVPNAEGASPASPPSSSSSWQHVGQQEEPAAPAPPPTTADQAQEEREEEQPPLDPRDMPITNAGPDAKTNIKRSGKGKVRPVPAPKEVTDADKAKRAEEDEAMKKLEEEIKAEDDADASSTTANIGSRQESEQASGNSIQPEVPNQQPAPERRQSETLGHRVASAFREEFGLDEAEELENLRQAGLAPNGENAPNEGRSETPAPQLPADAGPPGYLQRITDWFWGDIRAPQTAITAPAPNEERVDNEQQAQQEAPLVPVANGQPQPVAAQPAPPVPENVQAHDPEVLAAAQQAGLDADAIEDAEDLEGIFELIGLQGPLIGLFQTSTFCTILVSGTVLGAVVAPYLWGKVVLSFIGAPGWWLVKMPLVVVSTVADVVVDGTLMLGGWCVFAIAFATKFLWMGLVAWAPSLGKLGAGKVFEWLSSVSTTTASASGLRLRDLIMTQEPIENEILGWNWCLLGASVDAHASLRTVEREIGAVMGYVGSAITATAEWASSGSVSDIWRRAFSLLSQLPAAPSHIFAGAEALKHYTGPLLQSLGLLKNGSLTFTSAPSGPIDPSLVYWSAGDRTLAVLTGYLSLAAMAAVYVAIDQPITRSESGRKTEKLIRDTLRQAGGVLKVILIISIEMLAFPLYCGLLLDIAFLPLFEGASMSTRWSYAREHAVRFCFMHWFVGTCYMFHFALFVGMCRKILRKGVLWFIRDPDDPTFHPVRDVLERNVVTQLRKIAFSALVYGALVILCLGGVIWGIGKGFRGIFPICWVGTEPVLEFPMDLLVYNAVTPLLVRLLKPSDAVNAMYAWWLRRCARVLRLSHFLFDDRRKDEEGHYVHKEWSSFLLMRTPVISDKDTILEDRRIADTDTESDATFHPDGKYVLTPCNDQYRPPKAGEAFLHFVEADPVTGEPGDVYIACSAGHKNDHFAKAYVPPYFRLRITLFMVCLWMFSAFTGLCGTLVPLCFGRQLFATFMPEGVRVNDIYAYTVGAYILGGALFAALQGRLMVIKLREKVMGFDVKSLTGPAKKYALRVLKCAYVYGFMGVVLPTIFALLLQFYVILPLHTYVVSVASTTSAADATISAATNMTMGMAAETFIQGVTPAQHPQIPTLTHHTIHILQDYCLGLLYVRLATRFVLTAPASRAAEAFRRITANGYFNPDVRLATRFMIAPVTIIASIILLAPPMLAKLAISVLEMQTRHAKWAAFQLDQEARTKLYRYSYPIAAGLVMVLLCGTELGKATARWRMRIRDEVYLVGERLHNFGEKKPPVGSKSVVRKER